MLRRYAEWRPVAVRRAPVEWWGAAAGLLTAILILVVSQKFSFLVYFVGGIAGLWTTRQLVERRMKALRDDAEGGQFATVLRLSREVPYGFDEGLVAFIDGWLVYTGRRCAFSVRREDVLGLRADDKRFGFAFEGPAGDHMAAFTVTEPGRFGKAFWEWSRAEDVEGEPVFPPSVPGEAARSLYQGWAITSIVVFGVAFAWLFSALDTKVGDRIITLILVALGLPATIVYAAESRRALDRIAQTLPYRRHPLARYLGILPPKRGLSSVEPENPQ